jgi:hypothetical protein
VKLVFELIGMETGIVAGAEVKVRAHVERLDGFMGRYIEATGMIAPGVWPLDGRECEWSGDLGTISKDITTAFPEFISVTVGLFFVCPPDWPLKGPCHNDCDIPSGIPASASSDEQSELLS